MRVGAGVAEAQRQSFRRAMLTWAKSNLRAYPWRQKGINPYRLLIAEMLLKRTTAKAAARAYGPFLKRYPTIGQLALASEDELAQVLEPIGLSRQRSRAIRELALFLAEQCIGVPNTIDQLRSIPGIGDYTAHAILSFGFDISVAVVDGNVERVIRRVFQDSVGSYIGRTAVQEISDALLPWKCHKSFNFAMLDLGALVCRPARPQCHECPLNGQCDYAQNPSKAQVESPLRAARQAQGLSLSRLAIEAGVSKLTIVNIEAGRSLPRLGTLQKIAQAMDVPMNVIQVGEKADNGELGR